MKYPGQIMMTRWALMGALAAGLLSAPAASAQVTSQTVKPLVMLLMDTSGSMEYEAGAFGTASVEFTVPQCSEPGDGIKTNPDGTPFDYGRSRLTLAKEVLTGTYLDYWCEYDYRDADPGSEDYLYPVPHARACSVSGGTTACTTPRQAFDGVLDVFRDQVKFVFASFDALEESSAQSAGMWSYGPAKSSGINLGIRNGTNNTPSDTPNSWDGVSNTWSYSDPERIAAGYTLNRGQLIAAAADDGFATIRNQNRHTQYEIGTTIGYWGTPLAPMVEDSTWFLANDPTVRPYDPGTDTGDLFANCRERIVILITDGRASQGEGVGGYSTTITALESLRNAPPSGTRVFVVGFNLDDAAAKAALLNFHQDAGGPAEDVFIATSAWDLRVALTSVIGSAQVNPRSRTPAVYTNATRHSVDLQYQFNAAYAADPIYPLRIIGFLEQLIYQCSADCITATGGGLSCAREIISLGDRLNARPQNTRKLLAVYKGEKHDLEPDLVDLAGGDSTELTKQFGIPAVGYLPRIAPSTIDGYGRPVVPIEWLGNATDPNAQETFMKQVIKMVRADIDSVRSGKRLGGITHATPVIQEAARPGDYRLRSWREYTSNTTLASGFSPECRPTVLYAGTHDGLIHAFRVDHLASPSDACLGLSKQEDEDIGEELWAIIPHHLLKQAHQIAGQHHFLLDGQLHLADVLTRRSDPLATDVAAEALLWRSVLTAGYGIGGRGYIALDVTDALAGPNVLWEIDNESRCTPSGCETAATEASDYSKLGLTVARPAYGTVFVSGEEVAMAVLPGGEHPEGSGEADAGKVVYITALDDGTKIAEFSEDANNVVDITGASIPLEFPISGSPAVYSNVPGVVATRVYVGDAGGRLWRIDMSDADRAKWVMQLWFDPYAVGGPAQANSVGDRQPVLGAPTVALASADGELAAIYGTGHMDYLAKTSDSRAVMASVSEVFTSGKLGPELNWVRVFDPDEKMTGEPIVYNKVAYFTSYLANSLDACDPGEGRLYGVDFVESNAAGASTDTTIGRLDQDGDTTTLDFVKYMALGDSVPFGVQVIERPACLSDSVDASDQAGGASPSGSSPATAGELELVLNLAQPRAASANGSASTTPPALIPANATTKSITQPLPVVDQTLQSAAWGYVLF